MPALLLDGLTLVVSPLIALQRDQLQGIADTRAPEAVAVNSAQRSGERKQAWAAIRQGDAEYAFLSPEQLAKDTAGPTRHRGAAGPARAPRGDHQLRPPESAVMSIEQDRLTVLFDDVGYKTLSLPAVHEHNILASDRAPEPAPDA